MFSLDMKKGKINLFKDNHKVYNFLARTSIKLISDINCGFRALTLNLAINYQYFKYNYIGAEIYEAKNMILRVESMKLYISIEQLVIVFLIVLI